MNSQKASSIWVVATAHFCSTFFEVIRNAPARRNAARLSIAPGWCGLMKVLRVTRANLTKADIWAKVTWGNTGRPDALARVFNENYGIALEDSLNGTFLSQPLVMGRTRFAAGRSCEPINRCYSYRGKRLNNNGVGASLLEHLKRWSHSCDASTFSYRVAHRCTKTKRRRYRTLICYRI